MSTCKGGKMFAGGFGSMEMMVIFVIVLVVFGAGKLPQVGECLGKGIRGFKKEITEIDDQNDTSLEEKE
jgi:sec-independent protein translocase protein TatA